MSLRLTLLVASLAAVAAGCTAEMAVPEAVEVTVDPTPVVVPVVVPMDEPVVRPDAGPVEPEGPPVLVPGMGLRYKPTAAAGCADHSHTPELPDDSVAEAAPDEWSKRSVFDLEENGGLDPASVLTDGDVTTFGAFVPPPVPVMIDPAVLGALDTDHDCLSNADEAKLGTDPGKADSDGDGWYDGPCNERRKLVLTRIYARDEQEDIGDDELYLIADDVRHPSADLDDSWDLDDGDVIDTAWPLAQRVRGTGDARLAVVKLEGWEDDFELWNSWTPDDLLFTGEVDLGAYENGATFTQRHRDAADDDYDYELTFRVDVERFADPTPLSAAGDTDHDGIREIDEARVAKDFGGIVDPSRADVLVELDWMKGHALRTQAKREVVTQYHRNGMQLAILRDEELAVDGCTTVPEARQLYADHFTWKGYSAFRYVVMSEQIWNDASGVNWGDIVLVDDSTWWINNWVLPQAGTLIHELGHTLGLTKEIFHMIDSVSWFSYDSAMNYTFQATKVDYSYDGGGKGADGWDFDDWGRVEPGHALRWSFALTTSEDKGICK